MSKKTGKLHLNTSFSNSLLYYPRTEAEKKQMQYSWANEDYRQSIVDKNIEGAISKPEEYLPFVFRHLTATIVGAWTWKATEFSEAVIKEAKELLKHKPVYVNHEMEVSNVVGVNGDIEYVGKSKGSNGEEIPGGLEGPIWIDARLHKDLCRKLTGYPVPHIQSVSVTVLYEWEPSHVFQTRDGEVDEWEFEYKIGTVVDGKMVRRIATKIIDFIETSFVYLGADPYAKILGQDGKPINIERDAIVGAKEFAKDPLIDMYKKDNILFVEENSSNEKNIIHLVKQAESRYSKNGNFTKRENQNNNQMEKQILEALAKMLNKPQSEITPDLLSQFVIIKVDEHTNFKSINSELERVKLEKANTETTLSKYKEIVEDVEAFSKEIPLNQVVMFAKFGNKLMKAKKDECIKLYKLTVGEGKESQAVIDTINNSSEEALEGFLKQYGSSVLEQFSGVCTECGGEKVTFKSTQEEGGKGTNEKPTVSMAERKRG